MLFDPHASEIGDADTQLVGPATEFVYVSTMKWHIEDRAEVRSENELDRFGLFSEVCEIMGVPEFRFLLD